MKVYEKFQTDASAEENGVWIDIGDGADVLIARFGNPRHEALMEKLRKPYRNILRTGGDIPADKRDRIAIQGMAETILLGWRGIEGPDGPIPYSVDNAVQLLTELKDFRNTVSYLALEQETFRKQALEDAAGN